MCPCLWSSAEPPRRVAGLVAQASLPVIVGRVADSSVLLCEWSPDPAHHSTEGLQPNRRSALSLAPNSFRGGGRRLP